MNFIKDIYIDITGNFFLLLGILLVVTVFIYFLYKNTMPDFSPGMRILLKTIKTLSTLLIILLLFGFIVNLTIAKGKKPKVAFIFDNTASVLELDKNIKSKIKSFFDSDVFKKNLSEIEPSVYTFSKKLKLADPDSLTFDEEGSNLYNAISELKTEIREKNIKTVFFFSDGIYTDGLNPENAVAGIDIPIHCAGIGDTTGHKDISITRVDYKKINYLGDEIDFTISVKNTGFQKGVPTLIHTKFGEKSATTAITLPGNNAEKEIKIKISPQKSGKVSVIFELKPIRGEFSTANNRYEAIIDILKKKKDVLIIAGYPSFDLKFLKKVLYGSERFNIDEVIYKKNTNNQIIFQNKINDSENKDMVIFLSFPVKEIESNILNIVLNKFKNTSIPLFFITGADLILMNTNFINSLLGINITDIYGPSVEVFFEDYGLGRMNLFTFEGNVFRHMPPVHLNDCNLNFKDFQVLLKTDPSISKRLHYNPEIPVMLLKKNKREKIVFLNGFNFWRWKFLNITDSQYSNFYPDFFKGICQYLSTTEEIRRVILKTRKDEYIRGEGITVTGEVYDEFFNPQVNVAYSVYVDNNTESETVLIPTGEKGKFEGTINIYKLGKHELTGEAFFNNKSIGKDKKIIYIKRLNVEYLNLDMNANLLKKISEISGGEYTHISNLEKNLGSINFEKYEKIEENTFSFRNSILVMLFIVFLLSLEWFLRKRWGLL